MAGYPHGGWQHSQQTDRVEFWATIDVSQPIDILASPLLEWQGYYNQDRGHCSPAGKTPKQRLEEVVALVPPLATVQQQYDQSKQLWHSSSRRAWILQPDGRFKWKRCR